MIISFDGYNYYGTVERRPKRKKKAAKKSPKRAKKLATPRGGE